MGIYLTLSIGFLFHRILFHNIHYLKAALILLTWYALKALQSQSLKKKKHPILFKLSRKSDACVSFISEEALLYRNPNSLI